MMLDSLRIPFAFLRLVILAALPLAGAPLLGQSAPPPQTDAPLLAAAPVPDEEFGEECTVGVACGKATPDGRPLLWKNRDAQKRDNVVTAFDDGKWPYVAVCDAGVRTTVWGGANAAGFCIMNSVSRDLPQEEAKGPGNGGFMKLALRRCATVADFAELLKETDATGRTTRANFGVIDAVGGAAIFETSHRAHRRFDADDTKNGIVVRTNFAFTADGKGGRERFARADSLCTAVAAGTLTPSFLLERLLRDLQPPKSAIDGGEGRQDVRETLHRQTTVASMVFVGCKPGDDPKLTTMWAIVGQPLFGAAIPCFPATGKVSPLLAGSPKSRLCDLNLELQAAFYEQPPAREDGEAPLEADQAGAVRWLRRDGLDEVLKQVLKHERAAMRHTQEAMGRWRKATKLDTDALYEHHAEAAIAAERLLVELVEQHVAAAK
jgi:hypothetical protein